MGKGRRSTRIWFCILLTVVVLGCSGRQHPDMGPGYYESLRPGYEVVYSPKIQPGMTLTSASEEVKGSFVFFGDDYLKFKNTAVVNASTFYDDRIEIAYDATPYSNAGSFSLFFRDLLNSRIVVEFTPRNRYGVTHYAIILPKLATTFRLIFNSSFFIIQ